MTDLRTFADEHMPPEVRSQIHRVNETDGAIGVWMHGVRETCRFLHQQHHRRLRAFTIAAYVLGMIAGYLVGAR